ncbi:hypothetical protein TIFTF001_004301 [Ficus carica]|uniref:Glycoside hydrolase family 5 domain-containing protein n=1 Tax=Ficus carica TaxID=3494 RepID=A0AA88A416_FICCA|nr:hypothetical protein TIFTF001_004301 [Ficus carica]
MYDHSPPKPFLGGSLQALERKLSLGHSHYIELHALRASQNGYDHSGSRDGYREWGVSNIQETVDVIDFLAKRYSKRQSLIAIKLMNEPWAEDNSGGGIPPNTLKQTILPRGFQCSEKVHKRCLCDPIEPAGDYGRPIDGPPQLCYDP